MLEATKKVFVKRENLMGDIGKTYMYYSRDKDISSEIVIAMFYRVLTTNPENYTGFKLLKTYKGRSLMERRFSIRKTTLQLLFNKIAKTSKSSNAEN